MIARIARFARPAVTQPGATFAAVEDALGVLTLFALLFLGLNLSGSI